MRLLPDTHVYLWSVADDRRLSKQARALILDADIHRLVAEIEAGGFSELPVKAVHAARVRDLPDLHRDPFDRLLIAQALAEPLHLLTADRHLSPYTDLVITV